LGARRTQLSSANNRDILTAKGKENEYVFMELISVGYENTKYLINRFVLQELGILLGGCLTVKN